jgi:hypothetical protein
MSLPVHEIVETAAPAADQEPVDNIPPPAWLATAVAAYAKISQAVTADPALGSVAAVVDRLTEHLNRVTMERAERQANPNPAPADFERGAAVNAEQATYFARLGLKEAAQQAWENVRALHDARREALAALQATRRLRALRALDALHRRDRAVARARQQNPRGRRSTVRLDKPAGRKKRHRGSSDDGPSGPASGDRHIGRQGGAL